ncbi:Auxin efflux carrier [Corchorus olitorius]|uniref:Auxin efflux carrier n=1 Tax=Corchorus olitorius TaxID=93759 RepID=A0A1R3HUX2_9ROSI|nr:Auxin efflux carrier [Corchorus olitorius]
MIRGEEVYEVIAAMMPLFFALLLGYGSVKWDIFTQEHSEAINRLVAYFTLPLFVVEFTAHINPLNPLEMNYWFIGADIISKLIILAVIALWAKCSSKGSYSWSITSFSLSTLNNPLVVGVPLMRAMYGQVGVNLVVESAVIQIIVWFTLLLFVLEFRRFAGEQERDVEVGEQERDVEAGPRPLSYWHVMKVVGMKLAKNPNCYGCILGLAWAFVANRWHLKMPSIIEDSILVMSRAATGTAMFSMGMFMANQEHLVACGTSLMIFGMVLRFIAGPAAMAIGAIAVGLHGDILRVVIIQSIFD